MGAMLGTGSKGLAIFLFGYEGVMLALGTMSLAAILFYLVVSDFLPTRLNDSKQIPGYGGIPWIRMN